MVFRRDARSTRSSVRSARSATNLAARPTIWQCRKLIGPRTTRTESHFRTDLPVFDQIESGLARTSRQVTESAEMIVSEPIFSSIPAIDNHTSVLAHTTAWSGNLESSGSLHVYGRVEGSLPPGTMSMWPRRPTSMLS